MDECLGATWRNYLVKEGPRIKLPTFQLVVDLLYRLSYRHQYSTGKGTCGGTLCSWIVGLKWRKDAENTKLIAAIQRLPPELGSGEDGKACLQFWPQPHWTLMSSLVRSLNRNDQHNHVHWLGINASWRMGCHHIAACDQAGDCFVFSDFSHPIQ